MVTGFVKVICYHYAIVLVYRKCMILSHLSLDIVKLCSVRGHTMIMISDEDDAKLKNS